MIEHLVSHLAGWLLDKRLQRDALSLAGIDGRADTWRLHHSRTFRIFWTLMSLFWTAAVALFAWAWATAGMDWRLALPVIGFGVVVAASLRLAWDAYTVRFEVSPRGIVEFRSGQLRAEVAWSEVTSVRYVSLLESYVVSAPRRRVRVSKHVRGILRFKALAHSYVANEALRPVLDRIADPTRA